jgi:hypothetical protein
MTASGATLPMAVMADAGVNSWPVKESAKPFGLSLGMLAVAADGGCAESRV